MNESQKNAIVLLSGGLDSTTVMACAQEQGFRIFALSFDYGQKNRFEFHCAEQIAARFQAAEHRIAKIDLRAFGGSSLTSDEVVEKDRTMAEIGVGIPRTYVPARNTVFLSFALAWAEVVCARDIFIGINAVDSSGYPDCRPEFVSAFEEVANRATRLGAGSGGRLKIHAPLMSLNKRQIITLGIKLGVDYALTSSCYDPNEMGFACGRCDACILRRRGFADAGSKDPIDYVGLADSGLES